MTDFQTAAMTLLSGLSKTEKFHVAIGLMRQVISTHCIALQTKHVDEFSNKLKDAKQTFNMQLVDFLEVFRLLDRESQTTFIKQLRVDNNG